MDLKQKILTIMDGQPTGVFATVRDHKPHSTFMMFFHEDVMLYVATDSQSQKIQDIRENNNVHVLLGREGKSWDEEFIEVDGDASVEEDSTLKQKFWTDELKRWIDGPDDPNYVLIKISPKHIYYIDKGAGTVHPEVLSL